MSKVVARIEGLDDLERKLRRLPDAWQGAALLAAVMEGADFAVELAEALAPRQQTAPRRGYHGADNIGKATRVAKATKAEVSVGAKRNAFWLNIREFGTLHQAADPWLSVTFDEGRSHVERLILGRLRKRLRAVAHG